MTDEKVLEVRVLPTTNRRIWNVLLGGTTKLQRYVPLDANISEEGVRVADPELEALAYARNVYKTLLGHDVAAKLEVQETAGTDLRGKRPEPGP